MSRRKALITAARSLVRKAWEPVINPTESRAQLGLGLGGAAESLGDVVGMSNESANRQAFSRELNVGNWDSFGGDVTPGKYIEFARFQIPASTEWSFGYGTAKAPENQGYLYVDLQSGTPNPVEGTLRLTVESATSRKEEVVADYDTETLDASKTDRTQKVPLPEQVGSSLATEDAYLVMKLDAASSNTDQTIDSGNSDVIIPATEYDLS